MGRWRALHVSCHIHRDHRTILWGWCSSLTFMWMLGKELCLTGFQGKHFYPVSPLACPKLASWGIVLHFQTLVGLWKNGFSPKNNTGCVWSCYSLHHGHGMTKCLSKYWWVSTSAAPVAPCLCWKYFTSVGGVFKKKRKKILHLTSQIPFFLTQWLGWNVDWKIVTLPGEMAGR